jgi:signal peptidase I
MDTVYIKLFLVFLLLAGIRLVVMLRPVPIRVRTAVSEYTDSGIIASVVAIFVVTFLLQITRVEGVSMEPTLRGGEYTLVDKVTYRWSIPNGGDIIVFKAPDGTEADYIKRVIATQGELVEVRSGVVRVNGVPLDEPGIEAPRYDLPPLEVPANHVFVLGDNRNQSFDSHLWDSPFLPVSLIRGKARVVVWPPANVGSVADRPPAPPISPSPRN